MFISKYKGWPIVILLYVDDCLFGGQPKHIAEFIAEFESRFAISSIENLNQGNMVIFLGHKIECGHLDIIQIDQEILINKGLAILRLTSQVKSVGTPLQKGLEYNKQDGKPVVRRKEYQKLVRLLQWITNTGPDIAFAAGLLGKFTFHLTANHWQWLEQT